RLSPSKSSSNTNTHPSLCAPCSAWAMLPAATAISSMKTGNATQVRERLTTIPPFIDSQLAAPAHTPRPACSFPALSIRDRLNSESRSSEPGVTGVRAGKERPVPRRIRRDGTQRGEGPFHTRGGGRGAGRSEEHTSELQSRENLVCRLLLEKKNYNDKSFQLRQDRFFAVGLEEHRAGVCFFMRQQDMRLPKDVFFSHTQQPECPETEHDDEL